MTDRHRKILQSVAQWILAVPVLIGVIFWVLNAVFVPRDTFATDQTRQDAFADSLRAVQQQQAVSIQQGAELSGRILCYMQAQNKERPVSDCVKRNAGDQ